MQRKIERFRRRFLQAPRILAVLVMAVLLSASLFSTVYANDVVTVTDSNGEEMTLLTGSTQPEEILAMAGVVIGEHDKVVYTAQEDNTATIIIDRAFPVSLVADGAAFSAHVVDGTVADLLAMSGIELGPDDYVEPAMHTPLSAEMTAQIHRVSFTEESYREEVPEEDVAAYVAMLAETQPDVEFVPSRNGVYDVTYRNRLVDGELESREITQLVAVVQPRDPGSTEFIPGVPCSTIEGFEGITLGPDGIPTTYTRVMNGAVATAYSSSGGRGASGLGLYCGTVAVNPNVIPYGTRLYITSADNSFVYGFAIATDCGTAMMEGRVDVDLYFETNAECLRFGKRALDVYILD